MARYIQHFLWDCNGLLSPSMASWPGGGDFLPFQIKLSCWSCMIEFYVISYHSRLAHITTSQHRAHASGPIDQPWLDQYLLLKWHCILLYICTWMVIRSTYYTTSCYPILPVAIIDKGWSAIIPTILTPTTGCFDTVHLHGAIYKKWAFTSVTKVDPSAQARPTTILPSLPGWAAES